MTIHEAIFSQFRQPLLAILYLLLTAQMALSFASFQDGRRRFRYGCLLHLLLSFVCFWLMLLDIDSNDFRPDASMPLPPARSAFTSLPLWVMFLYEALTALILFVELLSIFRYRKTNPTFESVKETMDLLPAGIAFGNEDGTAVFTNLAMDSISRALTGKTLTNLSVFKKAAGYTKAETQIPLPDGSAVWLLKDETIDMDGSRFVQMTATDITQQAEITKELEDKNKKLRELQMRLSIFNKQADRIIIAQELLSARIAVHNEVGNVLLESRHYLSDPAPFEEKKLLQALKNTNNYLLREFEEDDTARDPLTDAVEMASVIGVDVLISGPIPEKNPYRTILAVAVGECASNTVKHANGDSLTVMIRNTSEEAVFVLKNNGEPPREAVHESGGLLSLRALVENERGIMETALSPDFTLTIRLPKNR